MIDFGRSYFTWKSKPIMRHPHYKYPGFEGTEGAVHQVRIQLDSACTLTNEKTGEKREYFLILPCQTEYTIVKENLFQIPSSEWRMLFGREETIPISYSPRDEPENLKRSKISDRFAEHSFEIRTIEDAREITTHDGVIDSTLADELMNARTTYLDEKRQVSVTLEFPVKLINLQKKEKLFQVCQGVVPIPDLATWDGTSVHRVFLADLAFSEFDYIEFILQRTVEVAEQEKEWYYQVRGRDRYELHDPSNPPPGHPPAGPRPRVFHEVIPQKTETILFSAGA